MSRGGEERVLVGRARETEELRELLAASRVVTVTGCSGVGKSLLARTVAATTSDGPWRRVVHLRRQSGGPATAGALGAALVRALTGAGPAVDDAVDAVQVVRGLRDTRILLLLDDVDPEHAQCTGVVQRLLMAVPELRVLVTARHPLGLGDERVVRLSPLGVEAPADGGAEAPAVELFLARARAWVDGFSPQGDELRAVREVCRLLDGVPVALELAAGQLAHRGVTDLAALLAQQQRRLAHANYVLCAPELRTVWARVSALAGSFAEPAAVSLCVGGGVGPDQVPGCLARLAAAGVLVPVAEHGARQQPRYRMTRAAREFGAERLREAGEFPVTMERRLVHAHRVTSVAENLWSAGGQRQAVRLVREEWEELGSVLRYACARPEHAETALEMVVDLWFWWTVYDRAEEGRGHLLHVLPQCEPGTEPAVRGHWLAAWLSVPGDPESARTLLGRAWPAAVLAGDDAAIGRIAHVQGLLALGQRDVRGAAEHFRQAADTIPADAPAGPSPAVSRAALAVAQAAFAPGAARRSARLALSHVNVRDDAWGTLLARYARAFVDHHDGHGGRAWHRARRALTGVDDDLPAPDGCAALRRLIGDVESGTPPRPRRLPPARPRPAVRLPKNPTASPSRR